MINNGLKRHTIMVDDKYTDACKAIDAKFHNKMINIATLTISVATADNTKTTIIKTKTKTKTKKLSSNISGKKSKIHRNINTLGQDLIQIYLVRIDNDIKNTGASNIQQDKKQDKIIC